MSLRLDGSRLPAALAARLRIALALALLGIVLLGGALHAAHGRALRLEHLGEWRELLRTAHAGLDRPAPLEPGFVEGLNALAESAAALARRLEAGAGVGDPEPLQQALQGVQRRALALAAQDKGFEQLAAWLEQQARLAAQGSEASRLLLALRAEDAALTTLQRLRGLLTDAQRRLGADGPTANEAAQRVAASVQLLDAFQAQRSALLADLADGARRAQDEARALGGARVLAWALPGAAALLLAFGLLADALRRAASAAQRPDAPEPRPDTPEPRPARPAAAPSQPAPEPALAPEPAPVPVPVPVPVPEPAPPPLPWHEWRAEIADVAQSCERLQLRLRWWVDGGSESPQADQDEVAERLAALAGVLDAAREDTLNHALGVIGAGAGEPAVGSLERLDGVLLQAAQGLARLGELRQATDTAGASAAAVPRLELVELQSELRHLADRLAALREDLRPQEP